MPEKYRIYLEGHFGAEAMQENECVNILFGCIVNPTYCKQMHCTKCKK